MGLNGMMRTGVSGMNAQSTRLATVADNIANSGTNGYKKASVEFSSLVVPSTGNSYVSGAASTQVRYAMSSGNLQYTTSITDLAIDGTGFLVVQDAAGKPALTRAGSFIPDGNGNLINAAGYYLMGRSFALGEPGATTSFSDYERVAIPTSGLERVPSTFGSLASNLPFDAPQIAGHRPSSNPPTDVQVRQGMEDGSIFKSGLTAIGNAGEPIRLDIYFTRTSVMDASGVTVNANDPLISGYTLPSTSIPPAPILNANNPVVSAYSAPGTNIANGANDNFTFVGFSGLPWRVGDTTSFTIQIDGTAVDVTGTYTGSTWAFAADDPASIPAGIGINYDTSDGDLEIDITNASGGPVAVGVSGFISHTYYDDLSVSFPGFSSLYWDEDNTVSFNVDIDGSPVGVTGIFNNGVWSFAPDDPATIPAGVTITYDTSGPDLVVNLDNASGSAIVAEVSGFSSTTTALVDQWEMTVYHQPNAAAGSAFPYSSAPLNTMTLEFDPATGSLGAMAPTSMTLDLTALNGQEVEIDLSGMRQLATGYTPLETEINGSRPSGIDRVVINDDGILSVQYANGAKEQLYRLDLAFVQSPDLLTVLAGNIFQEGLESGQVNFGKPNEISLGAVKSGALEASNVDIAEELTNMIESQRNYTANSKVFQTGGELMDILVNLKR